MSMKTIVGTSRLLTVTALATLLATPLSAQTVEELVTFRPDNRAGSVAAAAVIAEMIAERSESATVRGRARSMAPEGALTLGADELLMDIGAHAFIGAISRVGSGNGGVVPAALPSPTRPVEPSPAPAVEPVARPAAPAAAQPAARPAPSAPTTTATSTASSPAPATPQRRNWGLSDEFSGEMRDRGGSPSSGGGGGGGGGSGGGGGGWN